MTHREPPNMRTVRRRDPPSGSSWPRNARAARAAVRTDLPDPCGGLRRSRDGCHRPPGDPVGGTVGERPDRGRGCAPGVSPGPPCRAAHPAWYGDSGPRLSPGADRGLPPSCRGPGHRPRRTRRSRSRRGCRTGRRPARTGPADGGPRLRLVGRGVAGRAAQGHGNPAVRSGTTGGRVRSRSGVRSGMAEIPPPAWPLSSSTHAAYTGPPVATTSTPGAMSLVIEPRSTTFVVPAGIGTVTTFEAVVPPPKAVPAPEAVPAPGDAAPAPGDGALPPPGSTVSRTVASPAGAEKIRSVRRPGWVSPPGTTVSVPRGGTAARNAKSDALTALCGSATDPPATSG